MNTMVTCPGCGNSIHFSASHCPHCGRSAMVTGFKVLAAICVVAFIVWLVPRNASRSDVIKSETANYYQACDGENFSGAESCADKLAHLYKDAGDDEHARQWEETKRDVRIIAALPENSGRPFPDDVAAHGGNHQPPPAVIERHAFTDKDANDQLARIVASQKTPEQKQAEYDEVVAHQQSDAEREKAAASARDAANAISDKRAKEQQATIQDTADKTTAALIEARNREAKKAQYQQAIGSAPLRPWKTLGGKEASRAKIVGYDNGVFTLEKADGKTIELRKSRMSKADVEYCDNWLESAGNP